MEPIEKGDVVQIVEMDDSRKGWVGSFIMVSEVRPGFIQGFLHVVDTHATHGKAFIRLSPDQYERIGKAVMVPPDLEDEE